MIVQPLELSIKNVRAVNSATIPIDGLTVLCGDNSTGKTTIASILQDSCETILNFHSLYRLDLFNQLCNAVAESFFMAVKGETKQDNLEFLEQLAFNRKTVCCEDLQVNLVLDRIQQLRQRMETVFDSESWDKFDSNSRFAFVLLNSLRLSDTASADDVQKAIRYRLDEIENQIRSSEDVELSYDRFCDVFSSTASRYLWQGNVTLKESGEQVFSYADRALIRATGFASVDRVLFLQSPFETAFSVNENKQIFNASFHSMSFRYSRRSASVNPDDVDGLLAQLINGNVEWPKDGTRNRDWKYARRDGKSFPLDECASGIRSLSSLMRLYAYGLIDEKTILILDEPEAHLHPKWVVNYARVLVELVRKCHVRILLASHSPDMVYALKSFALAAEIGDRTHFCQAQKSAENEYAYDFVDLGTNVGDIFHSFNEVNDLITKVAKTIRLGE